MVMMKDYSDNEAVRSTGQGLVSTHRTGKKRKPRQLSPKQRGHKQTKTVPAVREKID